MLFAIHNVMLVFHSFTRYEEKGEGNPIIPGLIILFQLFFFFIEMIALSMFKITTLEFLFNFTFILCSVIYTIHHWFFYKKPIKYLNIKKAKKQKEAELKRRIEELKSII